MTSKRPSAKGKREVDKPLGSVDNTIRPAFVHSNTAKIHASHLVDEGDLEDKPTGNSLRLWGALSEHHAIFGGDLERRVWEVMIPVSCELEHVMKEWSERKHMCKNH
jgi:alpha 1,2-mannosyltransferase